MEGSVGPNYVKIDDVLNEIVKTLAGRIDRKVMYSTSTEKNRAFSDRMGLLGYTVESYVLRGEQDRFDHDVQIAIDVTQAILLDKIDHVVLITNDGDLAPIVDFALARGKGATVIGFGDRLSKRFAEADSVLLDTTHIYSRKPRNAD